jgi:hypothetical protein
MVTLQANQELFVRCEYLVCQGGDYDGNALVPVYRRDDPEKLSWVAFHAGYIAYGYDYYNVGEMPEIENVL